ncbi:MAG TPA: MerR family transcriptional regulator [Azonexus sp.]|nr:MerR family transcriptional regulator [Azonexus sp.]
MGGMTIGSLATAAGVGVETVRYYQRRGLVGTPERGSSGLDGGVRRYDDGHLRRLRFIRQAQTAGFTLEQIGELLSLDAGQDRARARELARTRIAALESKIAELGEARAALLRLERACSQGDDGPCPIIDAFSG